MSQVEPSDPFDAARGILNRLPTELSPLVDVAWPFLTQPLVVNDGVLRLGHRPWIAPLNYAITVYPGLKESQLASFASHFGIRVPEFYANFLRAVNGAFCFGMSLAGVPRSMLSEPRVLDRRVLQCHSLASAATHWAREYRKVPPGAFHFGGRIVSFEANAGYFLIDGRIISLRTNGKCIGEWATISEFLRDELSASAALDAELHPPG
jgi:hypothetical protein